MRFYADENFPLRTVEELRRLGHDVLSTFEDGRANQAIPDEEVLRRAAELNCVILTLNREDFKRLHRKDNKHAGIVICTEDADRFGQAQRISEKVSEYSDIHGQLIRIYRLSK